MEHKVGEKEFPYRVYARTTLDAPTVGIGPVLEEALVQGGITRNGPLIRVDGSVVSLHGGNAVRINAVDERVARKLAEEVLRYTSLRVTPPPGRRNRRISGL